MATPTTQIDSSTARARVLEVVRQLLVELGSQGALPLLSLQSNLDRDLGLGSLERVELIARLELEFGVHLPDLAAAESSTPDDLAVLIDRTPSESSSTMESPSALRAAIETQKLQLEAPDLGVFASETLNEVLRYRALHDGARIHLDITEDAESGEKNLTLTFAELYAAAQRCTTELARIGELGRWTRAEGRGPRQADFKRRRARMGDIGRAGRYRFRRRSGRAR